MDTQACAAGWGVVVLYVIKGQSEREARTITELFGPVRVDIEDEFFMGAEKGLSLRMHTYYMLYVSE